MVLPMLMTNKLMLLLEINTNSVNNLIVFLKYISNKPAINFFRIPRKQNKTIYLSVKQLWKLRINNNTLCVIATSKGLKSLKECKKEKIGGKLMAILS